MTDPNEIINTDEELVKYIYKNIDLDKVTKKSWYYKVYLNSDHWEKVRKILLKEVNGKCEKCYKICLRKPHGLPWG